MPASDRFVSPVRGWRGRVLDALANARRLRALRRATTGRLPFAALASDVRDIVYANWLVPIARAAALVPPGVALIERDGLTLLTVLTYRHGHFGPAFLGPLRRLFPSPLQSNWRFYVDRIGAAAVEQPTVLFVRNVFDSALYAVGARLMSDALPAHLAERFVHDAGEGGWRTAIAGGGSAPSLALDTRGGGSRVVPPRIATWLGDWTAAVAAICLQDRAVVALPDEAASAVARIALPIDPASAEPLDVVDCRVGELLSDLAATDPPWCFRVPFASFTVLGEALLPRHAR